MYVLISSKVMNNKMDLEREKLELSSLLS